MAGVPVPASPEPAPGPAALPEEVAEFITSGAVGIIVAARDDRLVPSIAQAVGCRVSPDRDEITVLLYAGTAEAVARDVAAHRQLAVVFSRPRTHRTLQVKGHDASFLAPAPADVALVRRYLALYAAELQPLGWDEAYVQAALWREPSELMALRFSPLFAYHQTPGPQAGQPLGLAAAPVR